MSALGFNEKAQMHRQIRAIFVRYWVDLGPLSVIVFDSGNVQIRGSLGKLMNTGASLTSETVVEMFRVIEQVRWIHNVDVDLDNWVKGGADHLWMSLDAGKNLRTTAQTPDDNVVDLSPSDTKPLA